MALRRRQDFSTLGTLFFSTLRPCPPAALFKERLPAEGVPPALGNPWDRSHKQLEEAELHESPTQAPLTQSENARQSARFRRTRWPQRNLRLKIPAQPLTQ
jgi:hypothetical protein